MFQHCGKVQKVKVLFEPAAEFETVKTLFRENDNLSSSLATFFPGKSSYVITGLGGNCFTVQQVQNLLADFCRGDEVPQEYFAVTASNEIVVQVSFTEGAEDKPAKPAKKARGFPPEILSAKKALAEELCAQDPDTGLYILRGNLA